MDLDDLASRYREIRVLYRVIGLCIIGILPAAYHVYDQWEGLNEALKAAIAEKEVQEVKLKASLDKHQKLQKLQETLASYENQVREAAKKLPDEVYMDEILQKTELIAQDLGIGLQLFEPKEEIPSETVYKYLKLPIHVELVGTYGQIASFFDRVVHLETTIYVENIAMELNQSRETAPVSLVPNEKIEEMKRAQIRLRASCDLMIFRSMTDLESQAMQSLYDQKQKELNPPKDTKGAAPTTPPPPAGSPSSSAQNAAKIESSLKKNEPRKMLAL